MGVTPQVSVSETPDGVRVDVEGDGAEALLFHRGDALRALQTIVNTAFRRQLGEERKVLVDCQGFRRDKDAELRQMARFLAEKVKSSGVSQEMGPLNSYERRIVHNAFKDDPEVATWSPSDSARIKQITLIKRQPKQEAAQQQ